MNRVKRIIAILLVVATLLVIPVSANAEGLFGVLNSDMSSIFNASENMVGEEKDEEEDSVSSLTNVAELYLFYTTANPEMPHMWLYFVNTSDMTLEVGPYKLKPGKAVSMGTWRDRGNGAGIHYNLERYWVKKATYDRAYYIKTDVNLMELKSFSKSLDAHNNWSWPFNCCWFAVTAWNKCSLKQIPYLFFPQAELFFMKIYGAQRPTFTISKETSSNNVYKYVTGGSLERVVTGALYTNTGV